MSIIGSYFLANQAQATTHPVNMHINWQQWLLAAKKQYTRSRLRANTLEAIEPYCTLFYRKIAQEIKIETTALLRNLVHNSLYTRCFDFGKVDIGNSILHLLCRCITYRFP